MKKEGIKTIFWGLVLTGGMFLLWYGMLGNPFDEYRIMQRGIPTTANVIECVQDVAEDDRGHGQPFEDCTFAYVVNGEKYYGRENRPEVIETIDIIYLPENPTVYRDKLGAATGFFDWLFRKAILGITLLVILVSGGIVMIKNGVKEIYNIYYPPPPPPEPEPMSPEMIATLRKIDEKMGFNRGNKQ